MGEVVGMGEPMTEDRRKDTAARVERVLDEKVTALLAATAAIAAADAKEKVRRKVLIAGAVLASLVAGFMGFTLYQVYDQAHSQQTLVYERCLDRAKYDTANQAAVDASLRFFTVLERLAVQNPEPPDLKTELGRLYAEQVAAIKQVRADLAAASAAGVIVDCSAYKR